MVSHGKRAATLAVVVAALGYFVDVYDLILFGMVRMASLKDLGIPPAELTDQGVFLFNMQMGGMLAGGILWGVLGDKRGRLSVLFGSITLYSLANIANGFVGSVEEYAACRLFAGIGLAGELGAGITLVSELMDKQTRGYGTTIVAAFGLFGGVIAGLVGGAFPSLGVVDWRTAYFIGGGMGLALLVLRIGVVESGLFASAARNKQLSRGNFLHLFTDARRFRRYLAIIAVGIPVWYAMGILFQFAPEIGGALGMAEPPRAPKALFFAYAGGTLGDLASGLLSQRLHSRRVALTVFLSLTAAAVIAYFTLGGLSLTGFYVVAFVTGLGIGYWAVFVSTAAELFGTNLRATVATTVPNFVRGSAVLLAIGFKELKGPLGFVGAAVVVGVFSLGAAFAGLFALRETFGVDLDFHEDTAGGAAPGATAET